MNEEQTNQTEAVEPEVVNSNGSEMDKKRFWSIVAYFIFFLPLLTNQKDNSHVKFHVKQGLVLFISFVVQTAIAMVPVVGWVAAPVLLVINIVLLIIGILNAIGGREKELPLIGKFASHFGF